MFASDLGIKRQRVGPGPAAVTYDVNLLQQMVGPALGGAPYGMGVDAFGVPGMMVGTLGAGQGDNEAAIRGRWTKDEDDKLRTLCLGQTNIAWQRIAEQIDGRNTKQCRERWMGFLDPSIKHSRWTAEEDRILRESHMHFNGNRWSEIVKRLPGRTQLQVRDRWRRVLSAFLFI